MVDKKKVGIIRGGKKESSRKSLLRGGELLLFISEKLTTDWDPVDILIDTEDLWHFRGIPVIPAHLFNKVDLIWNTSHPIYTNYLKNSNIPVIGHSIFSHSFFENKEILKKQMNQLGIILPKSISILPYKNTEGKTKAEYILKKSKEIHAKFPAPWIIKISLSDSEKKKFVAKTFPELFNLLSSLVDSEKSLVVEESINGKKIPIHILSNFRKEKNYFFPIKGSSYEKEIIFPLAHKIYDFFDCPYYLKLDFILSLNRIYLSDLDFFPQLKENSHLAESASLVGADLTQIIAHTLQHHLLK